MCNPTSIGGSQEIFGPVLAALTFRNAARGQWKLANTHFMACCERVSESINVGLARFRRH